MVEIGQTAGTSRPARHSDPAPRWGRHAVTAEGGSVWEVVGITLGAVFPCYLHRGVELWRVEEGCRVVAGCIEV